MKRKSYIQNVRPAGPDHQVVTVKTNNEGAYAYCRKPCEQCPWRKDNDGSFPAEAFRHSASTSYDAAFNVFACHMTGVKAPATCAGFLLMGSEQNIGVRLKLGDGSIDLSKITDGGLDLHESYRSMAEANGVPTDDPALALCRDPVSDAMRRGKE